MATYQPRIPWEALPPARLVCPAGNPLQLQPARHPLRRAHQRRAAPHPGGGPTPSRDQFEVPV